MVEASGTISQPEVIEDEEHFVPAVLAGFGAALLGAILWAVITISVKVQIGWMAVGVGFLVGYTVKVVGKGSTNRFSGAGALLALFGCLLGNLLSACGFMAAQESISIWTVLSHLDLSLAIDLMGAMFRPFDLLFYGIALAEGAKLSLN